MNGLKNYKRRRIGLWFVGGYSWVGGLYYVLNLIKGLGALSDEKKPTVVLFYDSSTPSELVNGISYPYLEKVFLSSPSFLGKLYNRLYQHIFNENIEFKNKIDSQNIELVYPFTQYQSKWKLKTPIFYWICDFQHKFLPDFFSAEELKKRDEVFKEIADKSSYLVLSSQDAQNHFEQYYKQSLVKPFVLQFMSLIDDVSIPDFTEIKSKYSLGNTPYFIVSNQFWKHKNHLVVFKALVELKEFQDQFTIVFTGKEEDYRNPNYILELKEFITDNNIINIKMLGFIDRGEQLSLMRQAIAIIQPSKFEGWGTVVEDAKNFNKKMILSDIPIHHEQVGEKGSYFDKDDHLALARILKKYLELNEAKKDGDFHFDNDEYEKNKNSFGERVLDILKI